MDDLVPWSKSFLDDFRVATLLSSSPEPLMALHWEVPSPSWFKLNSDAAIDLPNMKVGIGVVIRDCEGRVAAAMASSLNSLILVECAEGLALLKVMKLAVEVGVSHCMFEFDAASLVSLMANKLSPRSDVGLIVLDLLALSSSSVNCSFIFRPRSCNMVAHGLAKFGVNVNSPRVWLEVTPLYVEEFVIFDFSGCS
ncbi:hypothetical protein ACOSQ3_016515 [Xanthoceras sorbifolium]